MTIDTAILIAIGSLVLKSTLSLNKLENRTIEQSVKLEYLERNLSKLERELYFEFKKGVLTNDNNI